MIFIKFNFLVNYNSILNNKIHTNSFLLLISNRRKRMILMCRRAIFQTKPLVATYTPNIYSRITKHDFDIT